MAQGRALIAYFSRNGGNWKGDAAVNLTKGNTEVVAEKLAAATGADLFEIEVAEPYPVAYEACTERAKAEREADARPALKGAAVDVSGYDTVFLGYPNWWGTIPMPVASFLDACDLAGKTVIPFCTNEGSGLGGIDDIRRLAPGATIGEGIAIRGGDVETCDGELRRWLSSVGR